MCEIRNIRKYEKGIDFLFRNFVPFRISYIFVEMPGIGPGCRWVTVTVYMCSRFVVLRTTSKSGKSAVRYPLHVVRMPH